MWFSLPGGAPLYEAGEEADQFYFLRTGRLGAFRHDAGHDPQFLGGAVIYQFADSSTGTAFQVANDGRLPFGKITTTPTGTSVGGGNCADGNCFAIASLCGPGSLRFPGPLALMAPCGGRSGLPKEAACAALAPKALAAVTTRTSLLENIILSFSKSTDGEIGSRLSRAIKLAFRNLRMWLANDGGASIPLDALRIQIGRGRSSRYADLDDAVVECQVA